MTLSRSKRGGIRHEISTFILWFLIAAVAALAIFLPAPGQARETTGFGDTLITEVDGLPATFGALPPPGLDPGKNIFGMFSLLTPVKQTPTLPVAETASAADGESFLSLSDEEHAKLREFLGNPGKTLTDEEYGQLKRMLSNSAAAPLQVALTNIAVRMTNVLIVGLAWLAFLWILRRSWNFWFDEDVYKKTWPSVTVVCTLLLCTVYLLGAQ
jgi:hypothetical protein